MKMLLVDFETRSRVNLKTRGADVYAADDSTEILCCGFGMYGEGQEKTIWWPNTPLPLWVAEWICGDGLIAAQNARFDSLIWDFCGARAGLPVVDPERWYCTAAQCRVNALPSSLEEAAKALGLKNRKDRRGEALIRQLSIPQADGTFNEDPELMKMMGEYCLQDIKVMHGIMRLTRPMSAVEHHDWLVSERINDRGILIDDYLAELAIGYADEEQHEISAVLSSLTNGVITKHTQTIKAKDWLLRRLPDHLKKHLFKYVKGEKKSTLDKNARAMLLEQSDLDWTFRQMVEHIDAGNKSSVAKFKQMLGRRDEQDGRVRGAFIYGGAVQTLRYTSRGLQLHNMRRECLTPDQTEDVIDLMEKKRRIDLDGRSTMDTLSMMLRPALVPEHGNIFVVGDWSAIEARALPWLANSREAEAVLDKFRNKEDIYTYTAKSIGQKDRQVGKVACIAEGQLVTTDTGDKPIETVTTRDRVWNGERFVRHAGLVYKGIKEVITYDGITATPDHIVFCKGGEVQFIDAARSGQRIDQSSPSGTGIRARKNPDVRAPLHAGVDGPSRTDAMLRLQPRVMDKPVKPDAGRVERVPTLQPTEAHTRAARQTFKRCPPALREPKRPRIRALRRARYPLQLPNHTRGGLVGARKHRVGANPNDRQDIQQRALRGGQPAMGRLAYSVHKHPSLKINHRTDRVCGASYALRNQHHIAETKAGPNGRGNNSRGERRGLTQAEKLAWDCRKARTYDLVNCEHGNRFCVNGRVVHNCLSLGFAGGVGAFDAMASNYGVYLDEQTKANVVQSWREANRWAVRFWAQVETAAFAAMRNPNTQHKAGRVAYIFAEGLMGGTLICILPSGQMIQYPKARIEMLPPSYDEEKPPVPTLTALKANLTMGADAKEWPRVTLWKGLLVENICQAVCADLLRCTLRELDSKGLPVVAHVHDEVVVEVKTKQGKTASKQLQKVMETTPAWAEGLPLDAEPALMVRYGK